VTDVAERLARKGDRGQAAWQMRLGLAHIGVWSTAKLAFLLSLCLNLVTVALILFVVWALTDTEVFSGATAVYEDFTNRTVDLGTLLQPSVVWPFAGAVAVLNTVLITVVGAGYALLYNYSVRATGGVMMGFHTS
jgi:NADH:ubiquinone oxidoreductase subunit 6 (subunit J)